MSVKINRDGTVEPKYTNVPNIAENVMEKKKLEELKINAKKRSDSDRKKLEEFRNDDSLHKLFISSYNMDENSKNIPVQLFMTYEDRGDSKIITNEDAFGLTAKQYNSIIIYPIVKNLYDNKLYVVSDTITNKVINPEYLDWEKRASSSTRFNEEIPQPPIYVFNCDVVWEDARFTVDKFNIDLKIENNYIFMINEYSILAEYKG